MEKMNEESENEQRCEDIIFTGKDEITNAEEHKNVADETEERPMLSIPIDSVLRRAHKLVVDYLEPKPVIEKFIEKEFLPLRDVRDLTELTTTTDKNQKILTLVRSHGEHGYNCFKTYLSETKQLLLLKCLHIIELDQNVDRSIEDQLLAEQRAKLTTRNRQPATQLECAVLHIIEHFVKVKNISQDLNLTIAITSPDNSEDQTIKDVERTLYDFTQRSVEVENTESKTKKIKNASEENEPHVSLWDYILCFIKNIGAKISRVCRGSFIIQFRCSSLDTLYQLILALKSDQFYDYIYYLEIILKKMLQKKIDVRAIIDQQQLKMLIANLDNGDIIQDNHGNIMCNHHNDMILKAFCLEHKVGGCKLCNEHRACQEQIKATDEVSPDSNKDVEEQTFHGRQMFKARIKEDNTPCRIVCICPLEEGMLLLADGSNRRLKKVDSSLKIIDSIQLSESPMNLCLIDNNKVATITRSTSDSGLVRLLIVKWQKALQIIESHELPGPIGRTAFHDDSLYVSTQEGIYKYNASLQQIDGPFEESRNKFKSFDVPMAVSIDGSKI